jgi:probable rRNA maturation factor
MKLNFTNKTETGIPAKSFEKLMQKGCEVVRAEIDGEIGLTLLDDSAIAELNEEYRGKKGPTDVLTFSYLESEEMPLDKCVGEIFISVETAKAQAAGELIDELKVLFVHGFLHIFGFGHENDEEEAFMEKMALKILEN